MNHTDALDYVHDLLLRLDIALCEKIAPASEAAVLIREAQAVIESALFATTPDESNIS